MHILLHFIEGVSQTARALYTYRCFHLHSFLSRVPKMGDDSPPPWAFPLPANATKRHRSKECTSIDAMYEYKTFILCVVCACPCVLVVLTNHGALRQKKTGRGRVETTDVLSIIWLRHAMVSTIFFDTHRMEHREVLLILLLPFSCSQPPSCLCPPTHDKG